MRRAVHGFTLLAAAALIFCGGSVLAQSAAQVSLDKCQKTVAKEAEKYVKLRVKAVANCLQKISGELVKKNSGGVQSAAPACVAQLRKTNDTRGLGKSLEEKMRAKIERSCDPATNPHALADVLGTGAGVPESLQVENLDQWCSHFGGDSAIDGLDEWMDCMVAAHGCEADQAISIQYPRVLEWLALVKTEMQALVSPGSDPNKVSDAVAALDAVALALDGDETSALDLACAPGVEVQLATCEGDLAACQADLAQALDDLATCNSNLATCQDDLATCSSNLATCQDDLGTCNNDLVACQDDLAQALNDLAQAQADLGACQDDLVDCQGLPVTGQTTSFGTGSDGNVQAGRERSFTDNGDGTITDHVTGLQWEKKHNLDNAPVVCTDETESCANPHDVDNRYQWCSSCLDPDNQLDSTLVTIFLEQLNHRCDGDTSVDCKVSGDAACELALGTGEKCGFAGYRDWRLPNVTELQSLVNYQVSAPATFVPFHTGCSVSCDIRNAGTCSCTHPSTSSVARHWSSTSSSASPSSVFIVHFQRGFLTGTGGKTSSILARAVRSGA